MGSPARSGVEGQVADGASGSAFAVREVRVGRARAFGPQGQPSAIFKSPVRGSALLTSTGIEGDEVGDPRHHGGIDKAVHAYPVEHYAAWRDELPDLSERLVAGAFGENLVIEGVTEAHVCLGDHWQVGRARLELSQARQPCWKLNVRFDRSDMARRVQRTGRTGWYFRVLEPGALVAGDRGQLAERPYPEWPLTRVSQVLYHNVLDLDALRALVSLPGLPASWKGLVERRLARREVEDWTARVQTPTQGR